MTKCYVACEVNRHMAIASVPQGPLGARKLDWVDSRETQPKVFETIAEAERVIPGLQIETQGIYEPCIHIIREVTT